MLVTLNHLPLGEGFGINGNLLDTNIFNLAVVIGVLVKFGGESITSTLTTRKENILKSLNDAEERFKEATEKVAAAKKQLDQASTKALGIRAQGAILAEKNTTKFLERAKEDIKRLEEGKQSTIFFEEKKAVSEIYQRVSRLALDKASNKVTKRFDLNLQKRVIESNLVLLEKASKTRMNTAILYR